MAISCFILFKVISNAGVAFEASKVGTCHWDCMRHFAQISNQSLNMYSMFVKSWLNLNDYVIGAECRCWQLYSQLRDCPSQIYSLWVVTPNKYCLRSVGELIKTIEYGVEEHIFEIVLNLSIHLKSLRLELLIVNWDNT